MCYRATLNLKNNITFSIGNVAVIDKVNEKFGISSSKVYLGEKTRANKNMIKKSDKRVEHTEEHTNCK